MHDVMLNFSKEEIFRLFEQSELSDLVNENSYVEETKQYTKTGKVKLTGFYALIGAGVLAGAAGFFSILKKNKLL
jgi:LPXTG-motif cell wall-anchored protein